MTSVKRVENKIIYRIEGFESAHSSFRLRLYKNSIPRGASSGEDVASE